MSRLTVVAVAVLVGVAVARIAAQQPSVDLDYTFFRERVQPVFLKKRENLARCYVCHSQGTPFQLQPLPPGRAAWNETESRANFEAVRKVVVPGDPSKSLLTLMPLATEAGGTPFHPGGKHFLSQNDPEWQTLAAWVRGAR